MFFSASGLDEIPNQTMAWTEVSKWPKHNKFRKLKSSTLKANLRTINARPRNSF